MTYYIYYVLSALMKKNVFENPDGSPIYVQLFILNIIGAIVIFLGSLLSIISADVMGSHIGGGYLGGPIDKYHDDNFKGELIGFRFP